MNFSQNNTLFAQIGIGIMILMLLVMSGKDSITVKEEETRIVVSSDGGKTEAHYSHGPLSSIKIHPIMRQKFGIGMPGNSAVTANIYYVTPQGLANKRNSYMSEQGCFETFSYDDMEHLFVVADNTDLTSSIRYSTPHLEGGESTVTLEGYFLQPRGLFVEQKESDKNWSQYFPQDRKLFYLKAVR